MALFQRQPQVSDPVNYVTLGLNKTLLIVGLGNIGKEYDAVIVCVSHEPYSELTEDYFESITKSHAIIADLKGMYRGKINNRKYWSF